jgi:cytochrome bd-type quinol oxidase subunit 2
MVTNLLPPSAGWKSALGVEAVVWIEGDGRRHQFLDSGPQFHGACLYARTTFFPCLVYSSTLTMEARGSAETLVTLNQITRHIQKTAIFIFTATRTASHT